MGAGSLTESKTRDQLANVEIDMAITLKLNLWEPSALALCDALLALVEAEVDAAEEKAEAAVAAAVAAADRTQALAQAAMVDDSTDASKGLSLFSPPAPGSRLRPRTSAPSPAPPALLASLAPLSLVLPTPAPSPSPLSSPLASPLPASRLMAPHLMASRLMASRLASPPASPPRRPRLDLSRCKRWAKDAIWVLGDPGSGSGGSELARQQGDRGAEYARRVEGRSNPGDVSAAGADGCAAAAGGGGPDAGTNPSVAVGGESPNEAATVAIAAAAAAVARPLAPPNGYGMGLAHLNYVASEKALAAIAVALARWGVM